MAGDMPGAIETYQALLRYGAGQADIPIQVSAQNKIARVMMFSGRLEEMEQYLLSAEKLAREYAETTGLAEMFTVKCIACNMTGDFANGVQYMAEAAQIGKQLNVQTQIVYGLTHTAMMLTNMTRFDEGWVAAQEASEAIDAACNLLHKAELLGAILVFHHLRAGDLGHHLVAGRIHGRIVARDKRNEHFLRFRIALAKLAQRNQSKVVDARETEQSRVVRQDAQHLV